MADLSNGTTVTCSSLFGHAAAASAAGACPAAVSARTLARLFGVALRAVATAGSVAAVGVVLALRGVLTPDAKRLLSFLSMNVTIPALLFTQAAASLRPALLAYAWPLLLLPFVYVGAALLLGSVALRCADAPPELRRVLLAAAAFGNSTGMPIVLLSVVGDLLITPAARAEYGPAIDPLSYLCVYLVLYPVLQWSVGALLVGLKPAARGGAAAAPQPAPQPQPPPGSPAASAARGGYESLVAEESELLCPSSQRRAAGGDDDSDDDGGAAAAPAPARAPAPFAAASALLRALAPQLLNPPVVACVLGAAVGLLPFGPALFVAPASPLGWAFAGAAKLGAAAVPLNLLVLGASLAKGFAPEAAGSLGWRPVLAVAAVRLVAMPAFALALVASAHACAPWLLPPEPYDDAFCLAALVVASLPTANNVVVMAELAGAAGGPALSTAIIAQYAAAPLALSLALAAFLALTAAAI